MKSAQAEAGMSAAATSVGNLLQQERLRKRLDLAGIAKSIRIPTAILEAIEEDRFDCIPGGSYRRHFIRQYACSLGLDGDSIIAEFKKQYEEPPLPLPVPPKTRRSSLWADLAWTIVVIGSVAATYHVAQNRRAAARREEQALQIQTESMRPPAPPDRPLAAVPPPPETAPPVSTAPLHVSLTATEPVWVSVKCDGNMSYAGTLEAPESKTFDAAGAVIAVIGNAGGVQISLNGKPVAPLGAHGEVETVELTLHGARRIAREPAPAEASTIPQ